MTNMVATCVDLCRSTLTYTCLQERHGRTLGILAVHIVAESQAAREGVNLTARSAIKDVCVAVERSVRGPSVRAMSQHKVIRAKVRDTSVRGKDVSDFAIPRHLVFATGCYMGAFGVVTDTAGRQGWHLKLGKAVEQSITMRIRDHYNERPHNFVLFWVVGCDPSFCGLVEATMLHIAGKVMGLATIGGSFEEFFLPLDDIDSVLGAVKEGVVSRHCDMVTLAENIPRDVHVELQTKKLDILSALAQSNDTRISERAIQAIVDCS